MFVTISSTTGSTSIRVRPRRLLSGPIFTPGCGRTDSSRSAESKFLYIRTSFVPHGYWLEIVKKPDNPITIRRSYFFRGPGSTGEGLLNTAPILHPGRALVKKIFNWRMLLEVLCYVAVTGLLLCYTTATDATT